MRKFSYGETMKTCRMEILDDDYKEKASKKKSKSFPKIISIIFLILLILLIILKNMSII